jgi:hypothetical protein
MTTEEIRHNEAIKKAVEIRDEMLGRLDIDNAFAEACYRLAKAQIERDLVVKGACKAVFRVTGEECVLSKGHAGVHTDKHGQCWQNEKTYMDAG